MFAASAVGQPPVPPARLALAIILRAYTRVSDDEVIEAALMDRRWQLVLGCLDCAYAPFGNSPTFPTSRPPPDSLPIDYLTDVLVRRG